MKIYILLAVLLSFFTTGTYAQPLDNLDSFEWSNRLILIHTPTANVEVLQKRLVENELDINDRHIFWFIFSGQKVSSNYPGKIGAGFYQDMIDTWFKRNEKEMSVILIGKDGTEKWRNKVLDLTAIFGEIDLMPMRQYEMKNQ